MENLGKGRQVHFAEISLKSMPRPEISQIAIGQREAEVVSQSLIAGTGRSENVVEDACHQSIFLVTFGKIGKIGIIKGGFAILKWSIRAELLILKPGPHSPERKTDFNVTV